jgi:hypothetical protein
VLDVAIDEPSNYKSKKKIKKLITIDISISVEK